MVTARTCPVCGDRLQPRDPGTPFWADTALCGQCGTPLLFRPGLGGNALKTVLFVGLSAAVYAATRPLPEPWAVMAFLVGFTALAIPAAALVRWFLWQYATPVPLVDRNRTPSDKTADPGTTTNSGDM